MFKDTLASRSDRSNPVTQADEPEHLLSSTAKPSYQMTIEPFADDAPCMDARKASFEETNPQLHAVDAVNWPENINPRHSMNV